VLNFPPTVRIWLATEPVDMRKSFRGLSGVVRERFEADPLSGHVFCFINRRRTMMKLLLYDRTGFVILYKKLSRGRFQLPAVSAEAHRVRLDATTLTLILEGIDLRTVKRRVRHRHRPWQQAGS
jgi:transposase